MGAKTRNACPGCGAGLQPLNEPVVDWCRSCDRAVLKRGLPTVSFDGLDGGATMMLQTIEEFGQRPLRRN